MDTTEQQATFMGDEFVPLGARGGRVEELLCAPVRHRRHRLLTLGSRRPCAG